MNDDLDGYGLGMPFLLDPTHASPSLYRAVPDLAEAERLALAWTGHLLRRWEHGLPSVRTHCVESVIRTDDGLFFVRTSYWARTRHKPDDPERWSVHANRIYWLPLNLVDVLTRYLATWGA